MDRIALVAIASGLVVILAVVGSVLGGLLSGAAPVLAAVGAATAGGAIVTGLVILERRTSPGVRAA